VEAKLKEIQELAKKSEATAVDELIAAVGTVNPQLHINVHKKSS
jgi:hypothetical protein